jgi:shikimate dehydrogenase
VSGVLRLGVVGDPLRFTLSPVLHRAGCAALGIRAESEPRRVAPGELSAAFDRLEREGFRGVNVTAPHKQAALGCAGRITAAAAAAHSVNTVGFEPDGRWGESTDGPGFLDFLAWAGLAAGGQRVLLLGAGGAARSLALALLGAGAGRISVSARRREAAAELVALDPSRVLAVGWQSAAFTAELQSATLLVNATPLGSTDGDPLPLDPEAVPHAAVLVDLVYGPGPTPWVGRARARGLRAFDGLGLLVHQARHSLEAWLGRSVPLEPLERAVGWPR